LRRRREEPELWRDRGDLLLVTLVCLLLATLLELLPGELYVPTNNGGNADEYCPRLFREPDYSHFPSGYRELCEPLRRTALAVFIVECALALVTVPLTGLLLRWRAGGRSRL
jgi:hypothetical protein